MHSPSHNGECHRPHLHVFPCLRGHSETRDEPAIFSDRLLQTADAQVLATCNQHERRPAPVVLRRCPPARSPVLSPGPVGEPQHVAVHASEGYYHGASTTPPSARRRGFRNCCWLPSRPGGSTSAVRASKLWHPRLPFPGVQEAQIQAPQHLVPASLHKAGDSCRTRPVPSQLSLSAALNPLREHHYRCRPDLIEGLA
jgi:hypothetical protein